MPALGVAALVQTAVGLWLIWRRRAFGQRGEPPRPANPFELSAVLQIAGLLGSVELVAEGAAAWAGIAGVLVIAAVSGLADVDAVTLSMGGLVPTTFSEKW